MCYARGGSFHFFIFATVLFMHVLFMHPVRTRRGTVLLSCSRALVPYALFCPEPMASTTNDDPMPGEPHEMPGPTSPPPLRRDADDPGGAFEPMLSADPKQAKGAKGRRAECISNLVFFGESRDDVRERRAAGETTDLTVGTIYEILEEADDLYTVVDDTGESYMYPKGYFRLVEDSSRSARG